MIELFDQIDKSILLFLNGNGNPYWDQIMWMFTGRIIWIPVIVAFITYFLRKGGWRETLFILLMITLLITLCDQISSSFCKPFFARLRPSHQPELEGMLQLVNGYTGGRYGFISSHAANSVGFAVFSALLVKRPVYSFTIFLWAFLTGYTRIYLGVHFPGDVLFGSLLGIACGYFVYWFYQLIRRYFYVSFGLKTLQSPYQSQIPVEVITSLYVIYALMLIMPSVLYPLFLKH